MYCVVFIVNVGQVNVCGFPEPTNLHLHEFVTKMWIVSNVWWTKLATHKNYVSTNGENFAYQQTLDPSKYYFTLLLWRQI